MKYNTIIFPTLLFMLFVVGIVHAGSKVVVEYFYVPGCPECEAVSPLVRESRGDMLIRFLWSRWTL